MPRKIRGSASSLPTPSLTLPLHRADVAQTAPVRSNQPQPLLPCLGLHRIRCGCQRRGARVVPLQHHDCTFIAPVTANPAATDPTTLAHNLTEEPINRPPLGEGVSYCSLSLLLHLLHCARSLLAAAIGNSAAAISYTKTDIFAGQDSGEPKITAAFLC